VLSQKLRGVETLVFVLAEECGGSRSDSCTEWLWCSSQCFALPNWSVGSTCISSTTICCLCLVRKVCSDVSPTQARIVATVQCVKEIFQIFVWKMNVWSGGDQG